MSWGGDIDDGGDGGGDDIASVVRAMRRMGTFIERSLFPPCSMFHLSTVRSLPQVWCAPPSNPQTHNCNHSTKSK